MRPRLKRHVRPCQPRNRLDGPKGSVKSMFHVGSKDRASHQCTSRDPGRPLYCAPVLRRSEITETKEGCAAWTFSKGTKVRAIDLQNITRIKVRDLSTTISTTSSCNDAFL